MAVFCSLSLVWLSCALPVFAQGTPEEQAAAPVKASPPGIPGASDTVNGAALPPALNVKLIDTPNDDGSSLLLLFDMPGYSKETDGSLRATAEVYADGEWRPSAFRPRRMDTLSTVGDEPAYFGWRPADRTAYVLTVDRYLVLTPPTQEALAEDPASQPTLEPTSFVAGETYEVRLVIENGALRDVYPAGKAQTVQQWFSLALLNSLTIGIVFAIIIMAFIFAARKNPNLFIRRIQGLEAIDEAIGRATEMGKPVLHINGLDPLSTLSTIAAVNILGRIARRVANYESNLLVPCVDPVVMTVSQEVVRNAYLEAGRPDAYREDHIYFVTDQQFSYVASVCGIMMREKPAANFMLGMFYAEALMLAETGSATGAIQIAGTDALAQLPFFITTCDYTLIGEELYAASAYLSREPMLLGSLKGQDTGKAFIMLIIVLGTIFATIATLLKYETGDAGFDWLWITHMLTPLV